MSVYKNNTEALFQYLQSVVKLEELQKMTEDLDKELEDSQNLMSEIKSIFNTVPNGVQRPPPLNVNLRREQLEQFLEADEPRLLMPDMAQAVDIDFATLLSDLKRHAEHLKSRIARVENEQEQSVKPNEDLNLAEYVASFNEFSKRLANIKLNRVNGNNRNKVLEIKLAELCENVNYLTQVVQSNTKLTGENKDEMANQLDSATALTYENTINKMLHSLNEVKYLLQNII